MFELLLKRLARSLNAAHLPYMIFGGQAVLRYGEPRLTRDIDVTLGLAPAQAAAVLAAINEVGLKVLVADVDEFLAQTLVLPAMDPQSGIRVDFVFALSAFEREAIERASTIDLDGVPVRFVSLEDLIVMKVVAGRPRDLEDVRGIVLKNPKFNREHVLKWLKQFDEGLDTRCAQAFEQLLATIGRP